jgi:hypothetical protein
VVLCPDVAPSIDGRFDCSDLLQRRVIHYGTAKASAVTYEIVSIHSSMISECFKEHPI